MPETSAASGWFIAESSSTVGVQTQVLLPYIHHPEWKHYHKKH